MKTYTERLALIAQTPIAATLKERVRGLEKESLRIEAASGHLAQTPHPKGLGSALCNPHTTTDFSEALLEFITEPCDSVEAALAQLDAVHRYTYSVLDDELLWVASMPCILAKDEAIPVAQYGSSNVAKMKTAYRLGLGSRYGRAMQTIAGIHFNFSFSDSFFTAIMPSYQGTKDLQTFKTERYLATIRNFHRQAWLLLYLFGASPAVCKSFLQGREHSLTPLSRGTIHGEYATALRMGDLGYTSNAQESLFVCYNNLNTYIETLHQALTTPYPAFETLGVKDEQGNYKQLTHNILQIENEYYSPIRPKRTAKPGETPIKALLDGGIEYIEVRCLDLNPHMPLGTDVTSLKFVELFLIDCLLQGDNDLDACGLNESRTNFKTVVNQGRKPELELQRDGNAIPMATWANESLARMSDIAKVLEANGETGFSEAVTAQLQKVAAPELTPSGKIAESLIEKDESFFGFAMQQSLATERYFVETPLSAEQTQQFQQEASDSLQAQQVIEAADTETFEQYLSRYYQQYSELD